MSRLAIRPPMICGLCGGSKIGRNYNAAELPNGIKHRTVLLCKRCDLSPDPPVRPSHGPPYPGGWR